ncbi:glycosyltransferase involved in cell wall biosynthesis [Angulomicrobium tetraedrale]|uniref:Glycosyltransferase involved in cell wall biosynthesis n=1 Tax=Ancylobacter tetraedralis TaxID=217068 RepID=A0A839ZAP1_9HYPH|nr:glycosyltransferase [Ancylobacter tetraedralis]MBB3771799.1 glycosyltransferase involved in cell wall biosynthesis [Ancylobacter tetraedralis]
MQIKWPFAGRTARQPDVLFVDDAVPDVRAGAGQPRAALIVAMLARSGARVRVLAASEANANGGSSPEGSHADSTSLERSFHEQAHQADMVIISRPHNMARFLPLWNGRRRPRARLVYDAEALFSSRERVRRKVLGLADGPDLDEEMNRELALVRHADVVLAVNRQEAAIFRNAGHKDVRVLGYASTYRATPSSFHARSGFLFVGPIYDPSTPNGDSIRFFSEHVWPSVRRALPEAGLTLAGRAHADIPANDDGVVKLGALDDLSSVYREARVFVAPTRFAAGIPLKVLDAASAGVPIVMTSLLAEQLGWRDGVEALVADAPVDMAQACIRLHGSEPLWTSIRAKALQRVEASHSADGIGQAVHDLLRTI